MTPKAAGMIASKAVGETARRLETAASHRSTKGSNRYYLAREGEVARGAKWNLLIVFGASNRRDLANLYTFPVYFSMQLEHFEQLLACGVDCSKVL